MKPLYPANDNHHINPIVYLLFFFVSFSKDRCGITYRFFILRSLHAGPYRPCTVVTDVETWWSASWWPCCCEFIRIQATKCCKNCCHWRWNLQYSVAESWIQKKVGQDGQLIQFQKAVPFIMDSILKTQLHDKEWWNQLSLQPLLI